jgi:hypothetical protein
VDQMYGSSSGPMSLRWHRVIALTFGLALVTFAQPGAAQKPEAGRRKPPVAVQTQPIAPPSAIPKPPPPPPVPEKTAPEPPLVTYDGIHLTIFCDNSTLADVLAAVRDQTGADIEIPANAFRERVAARLGPAPARDVLTSLLSGTDLDYVIQASDEDDQAIQTVILTPRLKATSNTAVATGGFRSASPYRRGGQPAPEPEPVTAEPETVEAADPSLAAAPPAPATEGSPNEPPPSTANPASTSASTPPTPQSLQAAATPAPAGSTMSQPQTTFQGIVSDLQQRYEQRRQLQQEANKAAGVQ